MDRGLVTRSPAGSHVLVVSGRIDKALTRDPDRLGIMAPDGRFLERTPLAAAFEILPDDCLVRVLQVVRTD